MSGAGLDVWRLEQAVEDAVGNTGRTAIANDLCWG